MRALLAADVVRIWEAGRDQPPLERALGVLSASEPETSVAELARLSIGRRDLRLLELRRRIFGETVHAFAECPQCASRLEMRFAAASIPSDGEEPPPILEVSQGDCLVRLRLPTSVDLAEANAAGEIGAAKAALLARCVLEARKENGPLTAAELSAEMIDAIDRALAAADPAAEVFLNLQCPSCEHAWQTLFDITAFFWKEISAQARRLLHEVDAIARAYGWSEAEILGLSARRRQAYLELIGT